MTDEERAERQRAAKRRYYLKNREKVIARATAWNRDNPERRKQIKQKWVETHPEQNREIQLANRKKRYHENDEYRDRLLTKQRAYWERTREERLAAQLAYREARREELAAKQRARARNNPEAYREHRRRQRERHADKYRYWGWLQSLRRRGVPLDDTAREYAEVLRGDPCAFCGDEATEIDHIDPVDGGGDSSWDNLTPLCRSCNARKSDTPLLLALRNRVIDAALDAA